MSTVLGIDLGGTKIAASLYDASTWKVISTDEVNTNANDGFDSVYATLLQQIESLRQDDTTALGVGVPGLVNQATGTVLTMPNIPQATDIELVQKLTEDTSLPVHVDNDANCFTLAEALQGAGRGDDVCVGVTMGTGVGGGIVIHGKMFRGASGLAGEIGHMLLRPGQPPYKTDDARGDVEQFLSGTAFSKRCEAAGKPEDFLDGEVCEFMRPEVLKEVAWLCTNLTHLLDPNSIIFGGSAGLALQPHLDAIETELKAWLLPGTPLPKLAIGTRDDAATLGAALLTQ